MKYALLALLSSVLIVIIWVLVLFFNFYYDLNEEVIVPEIVNSTLAEGISELKECNLEYEITYVSGLKDGYIDKTFPEPSTIVKERSLITLYVIKTPLIAWPNYSDQLLDKVITSVIDFTQNNGLSYSIVEVVDNTLPEGYILRQSVLPNTLVKDNKEVILYVVKNNDAFRVPDFRGNNEINVYKYLLNVNIGYFSKYEYSFLPFGTITEQSVLPGTVFKRGNPTIIVFTVSKGLRIV